MAEETKIEWIVAAVILMIIALFLVYVMIPDYTTGTLYMDGKDEPVCSGRLKTVQHAYSPETYVFECSDGRIIQNLTNFIMR